ncbi:MAG: DUF4136 domain-containing protein [Candidatus Latescibacterota bacterium]|nr:MAG: DUF4136 domain-containing protein [Candidatus Latescibacterota bacterium]
MRWMVIAGLVLLLAASGCGKKNEVKRIMESPIDYQSYVSPWADFQRYRTWDFVELNDQRSDETRNLDPGIKKAITDAITKQMDVRGYKKVTRAPDIVLSYHVAVRTIDKDFIKEMYDGSYYPDYRMDFSGPRSARKRWDEGSLIIFAFDTYTRKLIWEGTAVAEVTDEAPLDQRAERIDKAARWMFTSLPGRPRWDDNILRED